jgi:Holliday junction resolvase RusA-like endonuclease
MSVLFQVMIEGQPVAKGRPRFDSRSGRTHTPHKTEKWETRAKRQMRLNRGMRAPVAEPMVLEVRAFFTIPASWPKWKREQAEMGALPHTTKPDADNVLKAVEDALNKIVILDDQFIVDSIIRKRYALNPRVEITLYAWGRM